MKKIDSKKINSKKLKTIYFDNGATTPVRKEVLNVSLPFFLKDYANPSSFHSTGLKAKKALDESRKKIAQILNCEKDEIIFTGSGTESINLAIKGIAFNELINSIKDNRKINGHFITQKTEHDAVLATMKWLEKLGFEITYLGVDKYGLINLKDLKKSIKSNTLLVSIMYANNEIGTIQDLPAISRICKEKKVLFHTDACQGGEYLLLDVKKLGVDLMTLNGSKIYSFKGTGLLYKNKNIKIEPLIHGGGQEFNLRSGTENIAGIVALVKALEIAEKEKIIESKRLTKLRNYFIKKVEKEIPKTKLNGSIENRLPNNINFSFYGIEGESLLLLLNEAGINVSTGSACSSKSLEASHVLMAIGLTHELSHSSIRFSLGYKSTKKEIDYVINTLKESVKKLRLMSPLWEE
ncbi:MAG: cysteine desulfurase family protein [Candidatus ainarchaeum sp.]|nr:cysteine desulfurase family protein [Candidatus ainarchaeum sp.]